nr:hypothetical protein Iba_chr06aCG3250 [Ipomoea batatas]
MRRRSGNSRMLLKTVIGLNSSWMICLYGVLLGTWTGTVITNLLFSPIKV